MRLRAWCEARGKGEIGRLARVTGLSYATVHGLARDKHPAKYPTAQLISAATDGVVSIDELCKLPKLRVTKLRARKSRRRQRRAPASAALPPAAHG